MSRRFPELGGAALYVPPPHADGGPDPHESFVKGLLRTANTLRAHWALVRREGDRVTALDLEETTEAAVLVLAQAVAAAVESTGRVPSPTALDRQLTLAVTLLCFASLPILEHLGREGHELTRNDLLTRAGFLLLEGYPEEEVVECMHAGIAWYRRLSEVHTSAVQEWREDVAMITWAYAKTGDPGYLRMLGRLYDLLVGDFAG